MCQPHRVQHGGPSAAGGETPESFLFRESAAPRSPEQRLAAAKILVHLQDLCGSGPVESKAYRTQYQHNASRWFFNPPGTTDFEIWCDTAGFDPETVRQKARHFERHGFVMPVGKAATLGRIARAKKWGLP